METAYLMGISNQKRTKSDDIALPTTYIICMYVCVFMALITTLVLCARSQDLVMLVSVRRVHIVLSTLLDLRAEESRVLRYVKPPRCGEAYDETIFEDARMLDFEFKSSDMPNNDHNFKGLLQHAIPLHVIKESDFVYSRPKFSALLHTQAYVFEN